jgi:ribA/ribD-fused uncharacterized protein
MTKLKLHKSLTLGTVDLTQERIYFWGGIFSQWYISTFRDPSYVFHFSSAEQAMMYAKASTFNDTDAMHAILKERDPREQKAIGRTIKGYDDKIWNEVRFDAVVRNNYFKFSQNPELKNYLILTDGFELVEASPYDKIWGVGLAENDPKVYDRDNWDGENLLGKAIMEARDQIIAEL